MVYTAKRHTKQVVNAGGDTFNPRTIVNRRTLITKQSNVAQTLTAYGYLKSRPLAYETSALNQAELLRR